MVKIGHILSRRKGEQMTESAVATVPFREPEGTLPGVAVLTFAALLARARGHGVNPHAPLRADFHHLIVVNDGSLQTFVDFTEYELVSEDWLWVRPHQVLEFGPGLETSTGFAVLFRPGFIDETTAAAVQLDRVATASPLIQSASATRAVKVLADEYGHRDDLPSDVHIDVVRRLLAVVLLCITHAGNTDSAADTAFIRFRDAVEYEFTHKHHVQDYARALGYSVRTLTRACREVTGQGAKQLIDDRIVLEAKRLLVHTELSSAAIGARVGLSSPTAFTKFFRARTGKTPKAFRDGARGRRD